MISSSFSISEADNSTSVFTSSVSCSSDEEDCLSSFISEDCSSIKVSSLISAISSKSKVLSIVIE